MKMSPLYHLRHPTAYVAQVNVPADVTQSVNGRASQTLSVQPVHCLFIFMIHGTRKSHSSIFGYVGFQKKNSNNLFMMRRSVSMSDFSSTKGSLSEQGGLLRASFLFTTEQQFVLEESRDKFRHWIKLPRPLLLVGFRRKIRKCLSATVLAHTIGTLVKILLCWSLQCKSRASPSYVRGIYIIQYLSVLKVYDTESYDLKKQK